MANVDEDFVQLLRYRFQKDGTLYNHPVRNILLAALIDLKGDLTEASKYMCKLLNIKGEVLPLTAEKVELIGHGETDTYVGECEVSQNIRNIRDLTYDHPIEVTQEVIDKMHEADLIILSPGSLYTSIMPHLIAPSVKEALGQISAPIMYISNLVCQPGETDEYTVSDHVKALNRYLGQRQVDIVVANNGHIAEEVQDVYRTKEQKSVVCFDEEELNRLGVKVIADDVVYIDENGSICHNELKPAYLVFSYLMNV